MVVVAFIHPDLGIGGAERLICDAALALQSKGHTVQIFTSHHNKQHCFSETADGTLKVVAVGDWLPRHTFKKFNAFWAYIRMIYVAIYMVFVFHYKPEVVICDQISACIPFLKLYRNTGILFYCHFPDMLLTQRNSILKKIYRTFFDKMEEFTTGLADTVVVNSKYTSQMFANTFTSLSSVQPIVLYPSLNFESFQQVKVNSQDTLMDLIPTTSKYIFLSINRYERKKNLPLAIKAFKVLQARSSSSTWKASHLVIAGGYDERVVENKEHHLELVALASSLNLIDKITFMKSFSDDQKVALLKTATCLLYTPSNEHFGIVPIESMFMKCPVVACASGGPLETVVHEETGFLCDPTATSFAESMSSFLSDEALSTELGEKGHKRVTENFSFKAFTDHLDALTTRLAAKSSDHRSSFKQIFLQFIFVAAVLTIVLLPIQLIRITVAWAI